ncbi:MAG: sigma 54-interacting transcriptional regulator [Myxococcales bacterium]|nr:sigma 54-interacting transcriptional regulator [Myxococcales bacterium]
MAAGTHSEGWTMQATSDERDLGMAGTSRAMAALRQRIRRLADAEGAVLVTGETGVGKELAARALHDASRRAARPWVALNCAAVPRDLVEAELFGTTAGAFTGAQARQGLIRRAHRGTLFLDEIGDLALPAQAALLRALETRSVRPLGADASAPVDFRLVVATHRDLEKLARRDAFRLDLYHRISTHGVHVPPLRDRLDDLPALARAVAGPGVHRLTPEAWRALGAHAWPGNVRELRNVLLRTLALVEGRVEASALELAPTPRPRHTGGAGRSLRTRIVRSVRSEVEAHGGNVRAAARALGVSPTTVYRYLTVER